MHPTDSSIAPQTAVQVDRKPVYCSAAYLFAIAVMPGAVAPGLVGAAAATLGLAESRLGVLIAMYFAGFGLAGASAYLWIREVNWRIASALGILLMGITFVVMASTTTYPALLVLMLLNGCGAGLFGSPAITILGDMARPERGFSTMIIFSVVGAAILLALFPLVEARAGFAGVNCLMGGVTLACLLLLAWLPRNNAPARRPTSSPPVGAGAAAAMPRGATLPLLALMVLVLFTLSFLGIWTFFERVAHYAELPAASTSRALAVGTLFGALGAPLAAYLRRRIPMYWCYALVMASTVATLAVLAIVELTSLSYLLLVCSFQFWINAGFCITMALTAEVDRVGRYVALIPASEALGSFVGPVVTGFALEHSGVPAMIAVACGACVLGASLFAYVDRTDLAAHERPEPA
jgi:predicted MFS family arabinose efflux permease